MKKKRLALEREIISTHIDDAVWEEGGSLVAFTLRVCTRVTPRALDIAVKTLIVAQTLSLNPSCHCSEDCTAECQPPSQNLLCESVDCHTNDGAATCLPPCLTA